MGTARTGQCTYIDLSTVRPDITAGPFSYVSNADTESIRSPPFPSYIEKSRTSVYVPTDFLVVYVFETSADVKEDVAKRFKIIPSTYLPLPIRPSKARKH